MAHSYIVYDLSRDGMKSRPRGFSSLDNAKDYADERKTEAWAVQVDTVDERGVHELVAIEAQATEPAIKERIAKHNEAGAASEMQEKIIGAYHAVGAALAAASFCDVTTEEKLREILCELRFMAWGVRR